MTQIIGYAASVLTTASWIPQIYKTYKSQHTNDLSPWYFGSLMIAFVLWLIYAIRINDLPMIITNGFAIFSAGYLLSIIFKNKIKNTTDKK